MTPIRQPRRTLGQISSARRSRLDFQVNVRMARNRARLAYQQNSDRSIKNGSALSCHTTVRRRFRSRRQHSSGSSSLGSAVFGGLNSSPASIGSDELPGIKAIARAKILAARQVEIMSILRE